MGKIINFFLIVVFFLRYFNDRTNGKTSFVREKTMYILFVMVIAATIAVQEDETVTFVHHIHKGESDVDTHMYVSGSLHLVYGQFLSHDYYVSSNPWDTFYDELYACIWGPKEDTQASHTYIWTKDHRSLSMIRETLLVIRESINENTDKNVTVFALSRGDATVITSLGMPLDPEKQNSCRMLAADFSPNVLKMNMPLRTGPCVDMMHKPDRSMSVEITMKQTRVNKYCIRDIVAKEVPVAIFEENDHELSLYFARSMYDMYCE